MTENWKQGDAGQQEIYLTVDILVFSVRDDRLNLLVIERKYPPFKGKRALPGGFVRTGESLEKAAARELAEETGVEDIFMKKLTAYGDPGRDPRAHVVSVAFLALIDSDRFELQATTDALRAEWVPLEELGPLAFDHDAILRDALADLRYDIQTTNIAAQLLPEKFTLTELQSLYERILDRELDKRNFRRRIKSLGILTETEETRMEGAHRPARLYRFSEAKYHPIKDRIQVLV